MQQRSLNLFFGGKDTKALGQSANLCSSKRDEPGAENVEKEEEALPVTTANGNNNIKRRRLKKLGQEEETQTETKVKAKQSGIALGTSSRGNDSAVGEENVEKENEPVVKSPRKKAKAKAKKSTDGKTLVGVGEKSVAAAENYKEYNSLEGAHWKAGAPVPYSFLANAFDKIASGTKRLVKTQQLTEVMRTVIASTPDDLLPLVYLSVNQIYPAHDGIELGIGDATIIRALAESTGRKDQAITSEYKQSGDLGTVAQACRSNQRTIFEPKPLVVRQVFSDLRSIALTEGEKSVEKKRNIIKKLLTSSKKSEASYVVRALQGKLRIGLAEQTVLTSLAHAIMLENGEASTGRKGANEEEMTLAENLEEGTRIIKQVYSECPSYDKLVPALLASGVYALPEHCKFQVGIPVKPMLAKPTTGVQEVLDKFSDEAFTCEYKYDGERAQVHMERTSAASQQNSEMSPGQGNEVSEQRKMNVKIFSRNAEDNTGKYPDIISDILPNIMRDTTDSIVLDGEVVAYDEAKGEILPFQQLQTRKRKDVSSEDITVKVCYFAFDCLYLNGESLLQRNLIERRKAMQSALVQVPGKFFFAECKTSKDVEELQTFLDDAINHNTEGLIVKTLESTYEPSKRSLNWLKLKKDYMEGLGDSMDLVVVGAWYGKGKRTGTYGTFLLACYNDDTEEFETITKIGTGFSEEDLDSHHSSLKDLVIECPRPYYKWNTKLEPDVWFDASLVWEVRAADLTVSPVHQAAVGLASEDKGIALRFPRFLTLREDRSPNSATTSSEIYEMYRKQFDKTTNANGEGPADDDQEASASEEDDE